ncbi:MAG: Crp/Fnr family transcriptional regulator [Myxococcales bacterium]|nr:MAG: Crp/Fnr family transcriptional regulator [Myxococcales bacterium]
MPSGVEGSPINHGASVQKMLSSTRLFSALGKEEIEALAGCTSIKSFERREYLFYEGDPAEGFFIIVSGRIHVHSQHRSGRQTTVRIFGPGSSFAEAVLSGLDHYPVCAQAETACQVLLIRKNDFRSLISKRPEIALQLLGSMSLHLHYLVQQLENLRELSVSERLRDWLLARCKKPLSETSLAIALPGTKTLLANELHIAPETLSRTLGALRDQNWIATEGRTITINNPARFARADLSAENEYRT